MSTTDDIEAFTKTLSTTGGLLGIDLGTKTIGLALSDTQRIVATPYQTLKRGKFTSDAETLKTLISKRALVGVILGLPRNMDGSEGPRAQSTRAFAKNLNGLLTLPLLLWDERLSTVAAERALLEADTSRKRRAEVIDAVAASVILQGALDRLHHIKRTHDET